VLVLIRSEDIKHDKHKLHLQFLESILKYTDKTQQSEPSDIKLLLSKAYFTTYELFAMCITGNFVHVKLILQLRRYILE
jgi:hypothetical protein